MARRATLGLAAALGVPALAVAGAAAPQAAGAGATERPAIVAAGRVSLAEARRLVHMMDDIYKVGVLTTHRMYVQDPGTPAAVTWAKQVIGKVKGRGWPEARIFAAVDRPLNPENAPVDAFEREALRAFGRGTASFEKVESGVLRYATEIRIVDRSCIVCHVRSKENDLAGGVSYRIAFGGKR